MFVCDKCVGTISRKGIEMPCTDPRFFLAGTKSCGKTDKEEIGELGHYNVGNMECKKQVLLF